VRLERALEKTFGLQQALVAPLSDPNADPIPAIAAKTGMFLSDAMKSGMRVGVGWGVTLFHTLPFISANHWPISVSSPLLGCVGVARRVNPAEFAWRFAQIFQGDGYLMPTPAVVDSVETKIALVERCGLQEIFEMADALDAVLLSVGGIASATTFSRGGFLKEADREALLARGAVGDLLFHFFRPKWRSGRPSGQQPCHVGGCRPAAQGADPHPDFRRRGEDRGAARRDEPHSADGPDHRRGKRAPMLAAHGG